jgi:ABC-2 type transport system ATP-binding protein
MTPIIAVDRLEKHFTIRHHHRGAWGAVRNLFSSRTRTVAAVDDISFEIEPGELVGYLGPNGAGKSTTIKMLTGLLVPSGGQLEVNGFIPWRQRRRYVADIGAVFGQRTTLWWDLPLVESLDLLKYIYRVPEARFNANLAEFTKLLDLDEFMDTPVRSLSLGQRMRADIAAALLHDPSLVFLDEPTIGLDVVAKERIRQFIRHINRARGTTVMLTTHDISDVRKLCDRILIIDKGKLLYDGTLDALQERFGGAREMVVDFDSMPDHIDLPGGATADQSGTRMIISFDPRQVRTRTLIQDLSARFDLQDLTVREPDIEATIRRIYEERLLES